MRKLLAALLIIMLFQSCALKKRRIVYGMKMKRHCVVDTIHLNPMKQLTINQLTIKH